jgi:hypothetical protein
MAAVRLTAILLVALLAAGQQTPSRDSAIASKISEPKLPVIDDDACPGKGKTVPNVKVDKNDRIYSSPDKGRLLGTLKAGEKVTVLSGANVIRQPGRALVRYVPPDDSSLPSLKLGDVLLVYGMHADGDVVFWSKGNWFKQYYEAVAEKGACGFTSGFGLGGCTVEIVQDGMSEWWMQVKTSSGITGWALVGKFDGDKRWYGNFSDLCRLD